MKIYNLFHFLMDSSGTHNKIVKVHMLSPAPKKRNAPKAVRFSFLERFVRRDSRSRV